METLDKLIPLVILGVVAVFLAYLARRARREKEAWPRSEVVQSTPPPAVAPEPIAVPVIVTAEEKFPAVAEVITATLTAPVPRKRRKNALTPTITTAAPATPIHTVLGLLKQKNSLATAFLLREILAPPVSKRSRPLPV